jgi:hypothetical protein
MSISVFSAIRSRVPGLSVLGLCTAIGVAGFTNSAAAVVTFDQNITQDVIFGSGNANGGWTVERVNGLEVGLRAKVRFDAGGSPQNIFNSLGNGVYEHQAGQHNSNGRARWSFEWSINVDYDTNNPTGRTLGGSGLEYVIRMDSDPGPGTNFLEFDPINVGCADHALGINGTGNGGGTSFSCPGQAGNYAAQLLTDNVAQNSWQLNFFTDLLPLGFNPDIGGLYDFELEVVGTPDFDGAATRIQVRVVPEPGMLAIFGLGLVGLGLARRKRAA